MIPVKTIEITRGEGPYENTRFPVGETFTLGCWSDAEAVLLGIANCKRKSGDVNCYDKTDFKVTWDDGKTYEGRADVTANGEDTDLRRHIREYLGLMCGRWRPVWMDDKTWNRTQSDYQREGYAEPAAAFLDTYDLKG